LGLRVQKGRPVDRLLGRKSRGDLPVLFGFETLYLAFALHDQADGYGLDAAGTKAARDFRAQERAELVTHHAIEEAARLLGGDAVHINGTRVSESVLNRSLGDFIEGDPVGSCVLQAERFLEVPGNRLTFAIRIRRKIHRPGLGGLFLERSENVLAL